jgi:hypothetical protein
VCAYTGACRASASRPSTVLVKQIQAAAEAGKPVECIALAEALGTCGTQAVCDVLAGYPRQGPTLVHFSVQPEPFLTPLNTS